MKSDGPNKSLVLLMEDTEECMKEAINTCILYYIIHFTVFKTMWFCKF